MTNQEVEAALQPFRHMATSGKGGVGLGLSLSKALAESNRATLHISSAPGEGTLVELLFPPSRVLVDKPE
jgi:signal transduction histidine kinase